MAGKFRGESTHKVDAKGRVSIPAAFRRVLAENDPDWHEGEAPSLILVYGGASRKFLEGYSIAAMADVDEKIDRLPRGSRNRRILERTFYGQATHIQVDETGRLVLAPKLRAKAGITDEAVFIASGDTFQIWSPEAYAEDMEKFESFHDEFDENFDVLSLLEPDPGV